MHNIAVLALHGVIAFELSIPCEVFGRVRVPGLRQAYDVRVCGEAKDIKAGAFDIRVPWDLSHLPDADTVIVPGLDNAMMPIADEALDALRAAAAGGARIASICSGAFVLAAAGLLDGLRATTHWLAASQLASRYPDVTVDPNVLFVDNGQILTSAGAAAGLDLCLHMVRCDHGAAVAADAARLAVMPLEREGGQAQFILSEPPSAPDALQPLLGWLLQHLDQPLQLEDIARQAAMSTRTLSRRFLEQTGTTPLQWLLAQRVRRAQELLETTALSIEQVATAAGFGSAAAFRDRFSKLVGASPQVYRRTFGGGALHSHSIVAGGLLDTS
jgi:transcriptional regulator GlxA family with amidase domain